jgi:hypothetical protein
MIHDAQMDYYGKRLATCSSDRLIKIFSIENDEQRLKATLSGYLIIYIAMKGQFGKFSGHIRNLEIYWPLVRMIQKYLSGKNKMDNGQRLKNM